MTADVFSVGFSVVSLTVDVASSSSKASLQARASKSDQASAGAGFGALVDSNVANATSAPAPAESSTARSQPASRGDSSAGTGDRKDQQPQKTVAASDKPSEPVAAQTDAAITTDLTIPTSVVSLTIDEAAKASASVVAATDSSPTADASKTKDSSATADVPIPQPVVTGIVVPVAVVPVVATPAVVNTTPSAPADPISISATSATSPANTPSQADSTPATAPAATPTAPAAANASTDGVSVVVPEQTAEQTAVATSGVAIASKAKPAVAAQAEIEAKTDTGSAKTTIESATSATAELPVADSKPEAKPDATEKPSAKADAKTEAAEQADPATPIRDPRPAHASVAAEHLEVASAPNAATPATSLAQHATSPQPSAVTSANVSPPINASVQLASNIAVPVSGLAVNIAFNANAGRSRFEIRLDPAELGRIDVRLDVDRNGQVTSHLTVERPATLDLLRRDAPQLQRALEDAGLKTGDSGLQFSLRDQSQQQTGSEERASRGQPYRLVVDELPALPAEAGRTYARLAAARGGVDIRI